ncbi:hypothetical protein NP233_g6393 [Leucocoprinus birnbaumii]|uniref:Aspartate aminotransferase n=1 Tax=Leucocoprinus birnbaumii TaxID=56174 RepID=A0AAD5YQ20_9AGAR|nr:hypothetical protein NP233_g6393 [Leucocoprinus birnbaumii]
MAVSRVKQLLGHISSNPSTVMSAEIWQQVPLAPPDSIFKLTAAYKADTYEKKVNLGVGAYRDDNSKPWVLPVVKKATQILLTDDTLDHEYLPILGLPEYTASAAKLIIGPDSPAIQENRVVSAQTISGTGANHLGALFLSRFYGFNGDKKVYLSKPTWGVDPTQEQWKAIADAILECKHFAFFDCAYQGFASGDLDKDAFAVRYFVSRGVPMLVCQSFAKNAGLYGERVGALHVVSKDAETANRVRSQLSVLQRSEISNPPSHGARLITLILNDPTLFAEWKQDISTMANRIITMRKELYRLLTEELKTPGNWDHIINQIGMFSFTGISPEQSQALVEKAHVYLTGNGRISMAGLNSHNIRYFAEALDKVVRGTL